MAMLKQYFEYIFILDSCGIPRVTLEGERSDWVDILGRLEKLKEYRIETTAWYYLLRPVIARFFAAFDDPTSAENVDFWQWIGHYTPGGSGLEGHWIGNQLNKTAVSLAAPETLSPAEFWETFGDPHMHKDLILEGSSFNIFIDGEHYRVMNSSR
ncbi:hypothetical protein DFH08DRAFT_964834 [Mycena albidolilacea]|uniref:Uncharacterized protein n=1 Tax=Mycena albidolilacea TaxID=1033008 RepID=A0AAD6ZTM3_9AGAR|nr:hypothetical protein DFH08DRAFT_964834 [Mycena albidolilacea]